MINREFILKDLEITAEQRKSRSEFNEFGTPETHPISKEQLALIPDKVGDHLLSDAQKIQMALGVLEFEDLAVTFRIKEDRILKTFSSEDYGTQHLFLYENDVEFFEVQLSKDQETHLDFQATHLGQWKLALKPDVYNQLEYEVRKSNKNLAGNKEVVRGGLMDDMLDTIIHEIYKANRVRFARLPEDFNSVVEYGDKIVENWKSTKEAVDLAVNDETLAYPLRALKLDGIKSAIIEKEVTNYMQKYEAKGLLLNYPKEIISKLFENQLQQNLGTINSEVFEFNIDATQKEGGFDWNKTEQKANFWTSVLKENNFELFYEEFPKKPELGATMMDSINNFLRTYVPKGDIIGYPKEILARLMLYQATQQPFETINFKERIAIFEEQYDNPLEYGGFDPWKTVEGESFWANVQHDRNWEMYFEKYPETVFSNIDKLSIEIDNYKGKGQLSGYPTEVISILLTEQANQNNPMNLEVFENNVKSQKSEGGFDWKDTDKGEHFFEKLITWKVFSLAYQEFPVIPYTQEVFLETDLHSYVPSGQINSLPKEIIEEMLREQVHQGNPENISLFEEYGVPKREFGGFSLEENRLGIEVWEEIRQNNGEFFKFYEEMPEQKYDNSHLNNNNLLR
ncbi:hypothetical protein LPB90_18165 [Chryseobacterium sp. LC2016-29]|uniref:hypothetical protein n=1 Tax=Chryseobacterium sp. LC2016-29 TaxID=2897331 RepID=UPI001E54E905|nr:hypothetical protein [Chryseobacterium sp. LC2016-29]MCD0480367.1 hypothetical protein [Chryseobacterium sp. LC2016-29]